MCWNWLMVTKGLFIDNPIRKMLAFKHSKPWGEPSTILLCKAPVYQAFAVQSQFCMKLGEKVHSWLHTDTGLCSQGPSRHNASFFRGRAINRAITEAAHRLVHARPGVKLGRGGAGGSAPSGWLVTSKSCRFPAAFILMVDIRSARTVSVDCKASCSAGSDSGASDTSSSARAACSSRISSWSMRISSIKAWGKDCGITLVYVFWGDCRDVALAESPGTETGDTPRGSPWTNKQGAYWPASVSDSTWVNVRKSDSKTVCTS